MKTSRVFPVILAAVGLLLLITVHGALLAWGGSRLGNWNGGWLPWIAGGALMVFGLHLAIQKLRGKGHGHFHLLRRHKSHHAPTESGPHDGFLVNLGHGFVEITIFESDGSSRFRLFFFNQRKEPRSVPANATLVIETARPDGTRQAFAFCAKGKYLESENDVPTPHDFKAILQVSHGKHTHPPREVRSYEPARVR